MGGGIAFARLFSAWNRNLLRRRSDAAAPRLCCDALTMFDRQRWAASQSLLRFPVRLNCRNPGLWGLFVFQFICVSLLLAEVGMFLLWELRRVGFGIADTANARVHEHGFLFAVLIVAALGLIFTGLALRRVLRRQKRQNDHLVHTTGAFLKMIEEHFNDWCLTPSERDVALMALRGLTISEIAKLRQTRLGTIKSQCNAIYRKASVSGRPQLISLFIEELMGDGMPDSGTTAEQ
jgi:DNA-binding CsgD family transcriptional regulator/membrane protein implicated in regulation of membrane protease activity